MRIVSEIELSVTELLMLLHILRKFIFAIEVSVLICNSWFKNYPTIESKGNGFATGE